MNGPADKSPDKPHWLLPPGEEKQGTDEKAEAPAAGGSGDSVAEALLEAAEAQQQPAVPPAVSAAAAADLALPESAGHPSPPPASAAPPAAPERPAAAAAHDIDAALARLSAFVDRHEPAAQAVSAPAGVQPPAAVEGQPTIAPAAAPAASHEAAPHRPASPAPVHPVARTGARIYTVGEVGRLLGTFAAVMFLLDADGLLTWVRRMEVGNAQSAWLSVVAPVQKAFEGAGLTWPRRALVDASDAAARGLGSGVDPLFAEAWGLVEVAPYLDAMADEQMPGGLGMPQAPGPDAARPKALASTMLLVGDSLFAGNLSAAIGKAFAREGGKVHVVSAYQTATGLSRPDVFDWGRVVVPLIERERPKWVVCSFGANDSQAIRVGDKLLGFGEKEWEAVYRQRVRTMMREVASGGAQVLWLGLPPMRDEAYDRRAKHLNGIFKREARAVPGVDFMELSMLFAGADGSYATFLSDGTRLVRMRMEDGVHYAPAGAQSIARWVRDWAKE